MTDDDDRVEFAVLIPLKDPLAAKQRLRSTGARYVEQIVWRLAEGVVEACRPRPIFVVTETRAVERWALRHNANVIVTETTSLNAAVTDAYRRLEERARRVIVVHADLAHPDGLGAFEPPSGVTLIADHHGIGTTVLCVPTGLDFHFSYGEDSLRRHESEAERLGLDCHVISNSPWSYDVDTVSDLPQT